MNINLDVDEEVVRKVRKIAMDRDTTLTDMVRGLSDTGCRHGYN